MNLKKQLKLYLSDHGLTASELSRLAGVPKQSLSDWMAGSNPRDIRMIKRVADVFKVSIDHLVFGDGVVPTVIPVETSATPPTPSEWMSGVFEVKFRKIQEKK
jgi:transcriptional regulator with XRE-family HTH domain